MVARGQWLRPHEQGLQVSRPVSHWTEGGSQSPGREIWEEPSCRGGWEEAEGNGWKQ